MLRIAVVDDDVEFLSFYSENIKKCFGKYHVVADIRTYNSGEKLIESLSCQKYDLIFMDIDMPYLSGFDIANSLRKYNHVLDIIFVSAHQNFVLETIKFTPYRFIRKSRLKTETIEAVDAYCSRTEAKYKLITFELYDGKYASEKIKDISFFFSNKHDIFYTVGQGNDTQCLARKYSLKELEDLTMSFGFIRVHKTYLVNCRYVKTINSKFLVMLNDIEIPISHGKKKDIQEKFLEFLRNECDY